MLTPTQSSRPTTPTRTRARHLDAANELYCRLGIQRTSLEEVARAAKLSRITRTFASGLDTDLIAELMVRISASFRTVPSHIVDISDDDQLAAVAGQFLIPMLEPRR